MFVWARIPKGFSSSQEFVMELLQKAGVLVTPGDAFGKSGEGYVRIALEKDEPDILRAIDRIRESGVLGGRTQ